MGKPNDLVQGTLDLLILKTISLEPKHGWAIAKRGNIVWIGSKGVGVSVDHNLPFADVVNGPS